MFARFIYLEEDTKYWIVSAVVCLTILIFVATSTEGLNDKRSPNHEMLQTQLASDNNLNDSQRADTLAEWSGYAQFDLADLDPDKIVNPVKQY